ncbi:MAG: serine/threonine-protein kinase [Fuerstiella sp.]|nr:serine/threonine-protein kinase [Fuerstiella sp.]
MKHQLTVIDGQEAGRVFDLSEGMTSFGRSRTAEMQIGDRSVSRQHCAFEVSPTSVEIVDLKSSSGTYVNSQRVERKILGPGDEIRVGNTRLRVSSTDSEQATVIVPGSGTSLVKGESDIQLPDLIGMNVHDYQIESKLADGRSGAVFLATEKSVSRTIALKVLWPEISDNHEAMQRFVRAMKTMFPVRHENLIQIYNAGRTEQGLTWVAMEHVEGESMAQVIQRIGTAGMLDWDYAYRVAVHTARALEAAFEHQIVHRNIKPENILMRSSDQVVKLGDMMLAKAFEGHLAKQITLPGQLIGDLSYISPEATVDSTATDGRSDIYSLGVTCYALLTGRPPFEARSLPAMLDKMQNDVPQSPKKYQLSINDLFAGCVMKMLEKRPEDRHQSPTALLKDLDLIGKSANLVV